MECLGNSKKVGTNAQKIAKENAKSAISEKEVEIGNEKGKSLCLFCHPPAKEGQQLSFYILCQNEGAQQAKPAKGQGARRRGVSSGKQAGGPGSGRGQRHRGGRGNTNPPAGTKTAQRRPARRVLTAEHEGERGSGWKGRGGVRKWTERRARGWWGHRGSRRRRVGGQPP